MELISYYDSELRVDSQTINFKLHLPIWCRVCFPLCNCGTSLLTHANFPAAVRTGILRHQLSTFYTHFINKVFSGTWSLAAAFAMLFAYALCIITNVRARTKRMAMRFTTDGASWQGSTMQTQFLNASHARAPLSSTPRLIWALCLWRRSHPTVPNPSANRLSRCFRTRTRAAAK